MTKIVDEYGHYGENNPPLPPRPEFRVYEGHPWMRLSDYDALAARLAEAERLRDEAVAALESLERRATAVSNKGAVTGPQWTKLTIGILGARNLLASIKETRDDQ